MLFAEQWIMIGNIECKFGFVIGYQKLQFQNYQQGTGIARVTSIFSPVHPWHRSGWGRLTHNCSLDIRRQLRKRCCSCAWWPFQNHQLQVVQRFPRFALDRIFHHCGDLIKINENTISPQAIRRLATSFRFWTKLISQA